MWQKWQQKHHLSMDAVCIYKYTYWVRNCTHRIAQYSIHHQCMAFSIMFNLKLYNTCGITWKTLMILSWSWYSTAFSLYLWWDWPEPLMVWDASMFGSAWSCPSTAKYWKKIPTFFPFLPPQDHHVRRRLRPVLVWLNEENLWKTEIPMGQESAWIHQKMWCPETNS